MAKTQVLLESSLSNLWIASDFKLPQTDRLLGRTEGTSSHVAGSICE